MTDVRLTALNPVDSLVYPVACNTSGELIVADGGPDLTVTGDLTVEGTASFGGGNVNFDLYGSVGIGGSATIQGEILGESPTKNATQMFRLQGGKGTPSEASVAFISSNGSATFAGDITAGGLPYNGIAGAQVQSAGVIAAARSGTLPIFTGYQVGSTTETSIIRASGAATFAGNVTAPNITSLNTLVEELQTKMSLILRQIDISAETP